MIDYRLTHSADATTHEELPAVSALAIADLSALARSVTQTYRNFVALDVNNHVLRIAVMTGEYRWHFHPSSDECFLVLEGLLHIDLDGARPVELLPGSAFCIPRGVIHRTRASVRTVNLCIEARDAYTNVVFVDAPQNEVATSS